MLKWNWKKLLLFSICLLSLSALNKSLDLLLVKLRIFYCQYQFPVCLATSLLYIRDETVCGIIIAPSQICRLNWLNVNVLFLFRFPLLATNNVWCYCIFEGLEFLEIKTVKEGWSAGGSAEYECCWLFSFSSMVGNLYGVLKLCLLHKNLLLK